MKPPVFDYMAPASLDEALTMLANHAGEAKVIAGGQSLMPMLNFRLTEPDLLVDISRLPDLAYIREHQDGLRIGALTTQHTLEMSSVIEIHFPIITAAMKHVAHLAIRNRGTIGGSLAHADPAAELPMLTLLLDAKFKIAGPTKTKWIDAQNFFQGLLTTALAEDELLIEIELPALPANTGWGFDEYAPRAGDYALAAVATTLTLADDQTIAEARLTLMGVADTPIRAEATEQTLKGQRLDESLLEQVSQIVQNSITPTNDIHASADYRTHLAGVLTKRTLEAAWDRAIGENPWA